MMLTKSEATRKSVYYDEMAKSFFETLQDRIDESGSTVEGVAKQAGIRVAKLRAYMELKQFPNLRELICLAEMFNYDLQESVNYRYYHEEIDFDRLFQKIAEYGLTCRELGEILSCNTNYVRSALKNVANLRRSSVKFIAALEELVNEVEQELESA